MTSTRLSATTLGVLLVLITSGLHALPPRGAGLSSNSPMAGDGLPGHQRPPPDLGRRLGLTGDTLARVDALAEQHHLALYRLHREQRRAVEETHARFKAELAKVLTPEEMAALDDLPRGHGAPNARCAEGAMAPRSDARL